jgi:hypothetical protein
VDWQLFKGLNRVLRACRVKPALPAQKRSERVLVETDEEDEEFSNRGTPCRIPASMDAESCCRYMPDNPARRFTGASEKLLVCRFNLRIVVAIRDKFLKMQNQSLW